MLLTSSAIVSPICCKFFHNRLHSVRQTRESKTACEPITNRWKVIKSAMVDHNPLGEWVMTCGITSGSCKYVKMTGEPSKDTEWMNWANTLTKNTNKPNDNFNPALFRLDKMALDGSNSMPIKRITTNSGFIQNSKWVVVFLIRLKEDSIASELSDLTKPNPHCLWFVNFVHLLMN